MGSKGTRIIVLLTLVMALTAGWVSAQEAPAPRAAVPEDRYLFAPVVEGEVVLHDFVVRNEGVADLHIEKIRSGCGCTATSFTRLIPPGGEGTVSVRFNTRGYGGRRTTQSVRVYTNDPQRAEFDLSIIGQVHRFADIEPNRIVLSGYAGETIRQVVTIRPTTRQPFTITGFRARDGRHVRLSLEQAEKDGQPAYLLTIDNIKTEPGRYTEQVLLETDSALNPEIRLGVSGFIRPAASREGS